MREIPISVITAILMAGAGLAQEGESFRVEVTLADWLLHTDGTIQSGIIPVDLRSDLGVEQNTSTFFGRLVVKPSRRNRLVFEGVPYRLTGRNTLTRQIAYGGRTYQFQEQVTSSAGVNYFFGGCQYDIVSRDRGHLGIVAGGAFLDASATVAAPSRSLSATESQQLGLPLVGVEFRGWATRRINLNGEVKGMSIGRFGHYVQGGLNLGVRLARWVTLQGGYMVLDTEVHNSRNTILFNPQFKGPVLSLQFRDQ